MSCCPGKTPEAKASKDIDAALKTESRHEIFNLLLLGPGESGKSTFFKQFKILYLNGFPSKDSFVVPIHHNVDNAIESLINCIETCEESERPAIDMTELRDDLLKPFPENLKEAREFWADERVKQFYEEFKFEMFEATAYFLDRMEALAVENYVPTEEDILRMRAKTTGIQEVTFTMEDRDFRVVDVGGQRSERRKWIHCFEGVQAVMFVVNTAEYGEYLVEESKVLRTSESIRLWTDILGTHWFTERPIILFLNKIDLLESKLKVKPYSAAKGTKYEGANDLESVKEFLQSSYLALAEQSTHTADVFVHFTCATDTNLVKVVYADIMKLLIRRLWDGLGYL